MIKALARRQDGAPAIIIGLSGENVARLAADEPILFDTRELGLPTGSIIILYGRTEEDLNRDTERLNNAAALAMQLPPPADPATVAAAVAATLRQVAQWNYQVTADELTSLADTVEQTDWRAQTLANLSCPMCEEIECDAGCPLEPIRTAVTPT